MWVTDIVSNMKSGIRKNDFDYDKFIFQQLFFLLVKKYMGLT